MSHYMTALAMKQAGLKPATKIVLYWLADHHNSETGLCCPSLNTLSKECEMARSALVRHIDILVEFGLVSRFKRTRENGSQTSTEYLLNLSVPAEKQPVRNQNRACSESEQGPVRNQDPHNLGRLNLGNEPVLEPDGSLSLPPSDDVSKAISFFNETAETNIWPMVQKVTEKRRKAVSKRLADVGGYKGWVEAIRRAARSPLLTGDNDRGWSATFDWLCNPANFTKLMEGNYDPRNPNPNGETNGRQANRTQEDRMRYLAELAGVSEEPGDDRL